MAMQFADSCDHYDLTADIGLKWTQNVLGNAKNQAAPAGRGTRAILLKNGIQKTLTYQNSWFVGFAFYVNSAIGGGPIYTLSAANSASATFAVVRLEDDSTISLYAGNTLNLIANSSGILTLVADTWNYIEIGVVTSGSSPILATVTLRVNGTQILSGTASTGVNASGTLLGTNQSNSHTFVYNSTNSAYARDFYLADGSGSYNNTFIGDIALSVVLPRADVLAQWTAHGPPGTATLFDHCNPQFPETNDDTTYISDATAGDVGNMLWQPITPFTGTIPFIHYGVYHRKDAEGTRTFQQTTHGTANGPVLSPGDSFQYSFFAMDTDPATGLPWTQTNFNAASFGVVTVS